MSDLWAKKKPPDSLIIFFMSKWPQKSSEHFTNILWARWGWASLKKRKDEMRENLCRDKIMREDMNGGTMRNKNRIFCQSGGECGQRPTIQFMSGLWAEYEQIMSGWWYSQKGKRKNSRVDKKKKQNGRENEEARGRKDKVGGEEKIKGLFMSGLWANYERPMSRRYTLQKNEHDEVQLRP